jgi:hypothetical protein
VQDVALDYDGNLIVSEVDVTRKGKFVVEPNSTGETRTSSLKALEQPEPKPEKGERPQYVAQMYQAGMGKSLLDRVVAGGSVEIRSREEVDGFEARKRDLNDELRQELTMHSAAEVTSEIQQGDLAHPFAEIVQQLTPLVKSRAAQQQLAVTLEEDGLAAFSLDVDDPLG